MVNIPLERDKPVPLTRQIQTHLERLIADGLLAPGVKLPATRELAHTLGVNRATVALAYEELVASGLARAHVGQGTFVNETRASRAASRPVTVPERLDWASLLSRSARIISADEERLRAFGGGNGTHSTVISFAGGMPDSALFPTDAFRRVLNQVIREEGESLLQYSSVGGYTPLRRYLAGYLLRFGVEARPEEILIVNGSQQGFDLIARTLVDPGDVVAIEQPTYARAMQAFRSFGARLLPVEWDASGPRARCVRAAVRAAGAQDVLLPAERSQSERTLHGARGRTSLAGHRRPLSGAHHRGRLRRQPVLRGAAGHAAEGRRSLRRGHLHRHVLQDPVSGTAAGLAGRAPGDRRASSRCQAAGRSAQQRVAAGGRAPVL